MTSVPPPCIRDDSKTHVETNTLTYWEALCGLVRPPASYSEAHAMAIHAHILPQPITSMCDLCVEVLLAKMAAP